MIINLKSGALTFHSLPSEYTRLESIQNTSDGYIDTGIVMYPTDTVVEDFGIDVYGYDNSNAWSGSNGFLQLKAQGNTLGDGQNMFDVTGKASVKYTYSNGSATININGNEATRTWGTASGKSIGIFVLMDLNSLYSSGSKIKGRCYTYRIQQNGKTVRLFVPCKNSSSVCGLYDLVEGKFYESAGTAFTE